MIREIKIHPAAGSIGFRPRAFSKVISLLTGLLLWAAQSITAQNAISVVGHVQVPDTISFGTDCWGYTDSSGNHYAIMGNKDSFTILDVNNPASPSVVAFVDTAPGFDVKVYQHYLYTCHTGSSRPSSIFDISDPAHPVFLNNFPRHHNILTDTAGYLYGSYPGLTIYSLADPANPSIVFRDSIPDGHACSKIGNRLFFFGGYAGTFIYDVTQPASPVLIDQIADPNINYHHSGYTTDDGKYLYICDELAQWPTADFSVWDISAPGNPQRVGAFADSSSTIHHLFVRGRFAFTSHYKRGFRIYDLYDPRYPIIAAEYQTFSGVPEESMGTGHSFDGCYGVYIWTPTGHIYASDMSSGFWIFSFDSMQVNLTPEGELDRLKLNPNPFVNSLRIHIPESLQGEPGRISVRDESGKIILEKEEMLMNEWQFHGEEQAQGYYFIRIEGKGKTWVGKVLKM